MERGEHRSKVQGLFGRLTVLGTSLSRSERFVEDSAILWFGLCMTALSGLRPESVLERGWGSHVPEDGDGGPS